MGPKRKVRGQQSAATRSRVYQGPVCRQLRMLMQANCQRNAGCRACLPLHLHTLLNRRDPPSRQHSQPRWFHLLPGRNSETLKEHRKRCLEDAFKSCLRVWFPCDHACGCTCTCTCGCGCGTGCGTGCGCAILRMLLWTGADQATDLAETRAVSSSPHCRTWSPML